MTQPLNKSLSLGPAHVHSVHSTSMVAKSSPLSGDIKYLPPVVYYTREVKLIIDHIVDKSVGEIGWLGLVEKTDNYYVVREVFIPEQTVSGATTDIEPEALVALTMQIIAEGKDPSMLRYWGHSHVNMGVSPSGRDEDQIEEYLDHADWFIRGIYNKKGASKVDVYDVNEDVIHQCVKDEVIPVCLAEERLTEIDALLKSNIKQRVYSYPNYGTTTQGNYAGNALGKKSPAGNGETGGEKKESLFSDNENTDKSFSAHELGLFSLSTNTQLDNNEQMEICAYYGLAFDPLKQFSAEQIFEYRINDPFYVEG